MGLAVVIMRGRRGTHWRWISWLRYWCIALCMQECVCNSINLRLNHKSLIIGAANVQILPELSFEWSSRESSNSKSDQFNYKIIRVTQNHIHSNHSFQLNQLPNSINHGWGFNLVVAISNSCHCGRYEVKHLKIVFHRVFFAKLQFCLYIHIRCNLINPSNGKQLINSWIQRIFKFIVSKTIDSQENQVASENVNIDSELSTCLRKGEVIINLKMVIDEYLLHLPDQVICWIHYSRQLRKSEKSEVIHSQEHFIVQLLKSIIHGWGIIIFDS